MIKSIQIYNPHLVNINTKIKNAYDNYELILKQKLKPKIAVFQDLLRVKNSDPLITRERENLVAAILPQIDGEIIFLTLLPDQITASPKRMTKFLNEKLNLLPHELIKVETKEKIEQEMWLNLVNQSVVLKQLGNPLFIWHLEEDYLTLTTTTLESITESKLY